MFRMRTRWAAFGVTALLVAFLAGAFAGNSIFFRTHLERLGLAAFVSGAVSSEQPADVNFAPVWRAWHIIDERYVDTHATTTDATSTEVTGATSDQERVWGLIQGLAASLNDPYTVFLPPSENEIFNDDISGSFEGVGMEIAIRDNTLTVVSPLKGTPAARAGIQSGDRVLEIDGTATRDRDIDWAVQRIRGEQGTEVVLTVLREGESGPMEISITRDVIEIPTIETSMRDDGIFVIEFLNFSANSPELFRNALQEFADSGSTQLIIDLRGNPGGYLEAAVDAASWFLESGKVVVTEDFGSKAEPNVHRSRGYDIFTDALELVILIDGGSASASEILAGSLQAHNEATVIGVRSFGKGSVQELVDVTSDTSLKITVARWLLPDDTFISRNGVEPDISVEIPDEPEAGRDYILERATQFLQQR